MAHAHPRGPASPPPLFGNLGSYHRSITTSVPEAQAYFDQGLTLLYGFNHDEAIRSFQRAHELDPRAPMPLWGIAIANGSHINNPEVDAEHARAAHTAIKTALAMPGGSPVERALVVAQSKRYANDPMAKREPLDKAYADAMHAVHVRFPDDLDAATFFAEAMMNLRPWDLWTTAGKPQPGTEEIVATLEEVLAKDPNHPGANHLLIHAVEASPHPERGLASADRLRTLVPGAGHLVHMPSHIYMRTGRYEDASEANREAIRVDREYVARSPDQHFYVMYEAHNHQFLWASAMMEGRRAESLGAARDLAKQISPEHVAMMAEMIDPTIQATLLTHLRFGNWDDVLKAPELDPKMLPIANVIRHYARGVAFVRRGELIAAEHELRDTERLVSMLDPNRKGGNGTPAPLFGAIAIQQLEGELAAAKGDPGVAIGHLRRAIELEDRVRYNEPPDWVIPSRQVLGEVLLRAGRAREAAVVYREDLKRHPENGFSLFGLAEALRAEEAPEAEVADVEARFAKAWARADVKLTSSRF